MSHLEGTVLSSRQTGFPLSIGDLSAQINSGINVLRHQVCRYRHFLVKKPLSRRWLFARQALSLPRLAAHSLIRSRALLRGGTGVVGVRQQQWQRLLVVLTTTTTNNGFFPLPAAHTQIRRQRVIDSVSAIECSGFAPNAGERQVKAKMALSSKTLAPAPAAASNAGWKQRERERERR